MQGEPGDWTILGLVLNNIEPGDWTNWAFRLRTNSISWAQLVDFPPGLLHNFGLIGLWGWVRARFNACSGYFSLAQNIHWAATIATIRQCPLSSQRKRGALCEQPEMLDFTVSEAAACLYNELVQNVHFATCKKCFYLWSSLPKKSVRACMQTPLSESTYYCSLGVVIMSSRSSCCLHTTLISSLTLRNPYSSSIKAGEALWSWLIFGVCCTA